MMINSRSISPISYSVVIGIALCIGLGFGLFTALSSVPANNPVVDIIFFTLGPVLTILSVHFLITVFFQQ